MDDRMLEREIEALLAVEPSPEFKAKVRDRVAGEPLGRSWRPVWTLVAAGVAAAILLVLVRGTRAPASAPELATRAIGVEYHAPGLVVDPPRVAERTRLRASADRQANTDFQAPAAPVVVISATEAAAWRRLLAGVDAGDVDLLDLSRLARAADEPALLPELDEFVLPPVVIEPLTPGSREQGVHQ